VSSRSLVRIGVHSVDLRVYPGALYDLGDVLREQEVTRPLIVIDSIVHKLLGTRMADVLSGMDVVVTRVTANERSKSLAEVARLAVHASGADGVVAVGGGTTGNLAGVLAHLLGFGVPLVNVATTVTAIVDASISIRHGINVAGRKGELGVFHPPAAIVADPALLDTLPGESWRDGAAEAVKAALIGGGREAAEVARTLTLLASPSPDADSVARLLRSAIGQKLALLRDDAREQGPALALHYGHTLGRALETYSNLTVRHGPSISAGMMFAARVSASLGLLSPAQLAEHCALASAACEAAAIPHGADIALIELMARDPKSCYVVGREFPLVLPMGVGFAHFPDGASTPVTAVGKSLMTAALAKLPHH
jgi:3-dehydroquinate synthetase